MGENKTFFSNFVDNIQASLGKNFSTENNANNGEKKKIGFFSSFSDDAEGIEKVYDVGRKEIAKLQKRHDELEDKLKAEIDKCTQEQENIKNEIETVQADMAKLGRIIEPTSQPGPTDTAAQTRDETARADYSSDSSSDSSNLPDKNARLEPAPVAETAPVSPSVSSLTESQKPTAEEIRSQLPTGGTRRRKKKTKRRRRRGCSRKRSKSTRGRGRLR